jgi:hypothetical protein
MASYDPTKDNNSLPSRIENARSTDTVSHPTSHPAISTDFSIQPRTRELIKFDVREQSAREFVKGVMKVCESPSTMSVITSDDDTPDPRLGLYKMPFTDQPQAMVLETAKDGCPFQTQMKKHTVLEQSAREMQKSVLACEDKKPTIIIRASADDTPDPSHGLYKIPFPGQPPGAVMDPARTGYSLPNQMEGTNAMEKSERELGKSRTVCETGSLNLIPQACRWRDKPEIKMRSTTYKCLSDQKQRDSSNCLYVNGHQYNIVGVIGKGGSCQVYHAIHPQYFACCPVAIKCVDLRDIRDKAIRDTFFKEVAVIEELNKQGCQHIIRLLEWEYNENDMMLYIVMEKGDMDLHTLLKEEGKPPMWKIKTFWDAMLRAVQEIHRFKIIHSDLKPANFIVMNRYALKLIDFGIADKIENEKTSIERTLEKGTPNYMAPEAIRASYHGKAQIKVKVDTHIHRHLIHRYICDPLCLCIRWGQLVMSGLLDVFFTHCFMEVLLLAMLSS